MSERFSFSGKGKVQLTAKMSPGKGETARTTGAFARFEDLTRKLVSVPKTEVDTKRQDG